MRRVNFIADDRLIARLDAAKEQTGVSIAVMIRRALSKYLADQGF